MAAGVLGGSPRTGGGWTCSCLLLLVPAMSVSFGVAWKSGISGQLSVITTSSPSRPSSSAMPPAVLELLPGMASAAWDVTPLKQARQLLGVVGALRLRSADRRAQQLGLRGVDGLMGVEADVITVAGSVTSLRRLRSGGASFITRHVAKFHGFDIRPVAGCCRGL
jgi:hypothetical protein